MADSRSQCGGNRWAVAPLSSTVHTHTVTDKSTGSDSLDQFFLTHLTTFSNDLMLGLGWWGFFPNRANRPALGLRQVRCVPYGRFEWRGAPRAHSNS